ncbi:hypothetical protein [Thermonema sp.]|uniref:hypothetical protein n=1 Tax=Thermonema sp. TaxID=2231181 RepID=UPI002585C291|nr:hypothetical protein [Thermonema sp.]
MMKHLSTIFFIWLLLAACESKQETGNRKESGSNSRETTSQEVNMPERVELPAEAPPNEILKVEAYSQRYEHGRCEGGAPCLVLELSLPSLICSQRAVGELLNHHIRQYPAEHLSRRLHASGTDITRLLPSLYNTLLAKGNTPPVEVYIGAEITYTSRQVLCVGYSLLDGVHYLMLNMQDGHRMERSEWLVKNQENALRQLLAEELRKMYNLKPAEPLSKAGFRFEGQLPPLPAQMGYASLSGGSGQEEYLVAFYSYNDGATEQTGTPEIKIPFSKLKGILKLM